ncbi:MAG: N-6 DNA methylase [Candidatus Cloacimonetes bacterium]|nr:N-6 DNA methylase [Candidatus Cloacimonadota bacterium]
MTVYIKSQAEMDKRIKSICDILRRDKAKGARLYVPELTWILFLCYFDIQETKQEQRAKALGKPFDFTIESPYRWFDWATPYDRKKKHEEIITNKEKGWKRCELDNSRTGAFLQFVNKELFPYLMLLKDQPTASDKQKIVSEIFITKRETILGSVNNLQDVLDRVQELSEAKIDDTHIFPISQAFEGLLPLMGEKKNDGGQFFTPREIIRLIVKVVKPEIGKTVYDPCCGTGGFLIEAFKFMKSQNPTGTQLSELKTQTLWGRDFADEIIPILLANMILHEIDLPRIWHGNTLTDETTYGDLFNGAPVQFDYVLTNPPFGSKESLSAQARFPYKSGKAQILFLQHIIDSISEGGICGMVIDEGVLFHIKTTAYRQTKRKLLNECELFCIISLPGGVFVNAGAGVKTNLLFFKKGKQTKQIWYYDMTLGDDFHTRKVNKGHPILVEHFNDCLERLSLPEDDPKRISERSWFVSRDEIEEKKFDLKAVNNNAPDFSDKRTPDELIKIIKESQIEINKEISELVNMM